MDTIKQISYFYNLSPKRQRIFEKYILTKYPEAMRTKLIDVYRTRWIARIDGMDIFQDLMQAIVAGLDEIVMNIGENLMEKHLQLQAPV